MASGPGRYDTLCTTVREEAQAEGAVVIILNGKQGSGFSCQATPEATAQLPDMLEFMAKQIRADMKK